MTGLLRTLTDLELCLEPFAPKHKEGLRAACAKDQEIWEIYPISMIGTHFDASLKILENMPGWQRFAIVFEGQIAGMTSYIPSAPAEESIEIGGTFLVPNLRGSSVNRRVKRLLIDNAFEAGFTEVQFRVDVRNKRSMRAVEKLGASHVAIQKRNMITWTGHVRDTAIYSLSEKMWKESEANSL